MTCLLDNQQRAINKLRKYKVGALFMEPGSGKTRTAYELIKSVSDIDYILWLTPFQTKTNLTDEINICGGFDVDIDIIGIETLSSSDRTYLEIYNKLQNRNAIIICDESLKIKNWTAKRTKRIIELSKLSEYKLILNGTPLSRNLLDLWSQLEFLSPKILKMQLTEFKNTFCEYIKMTKKIGNKSIQREWIVAYHNIDYLYSLIKYYVYESNLELNINQQYFNIEYQIEPELKQYYSDFKRKYLSNEYLMDHNNNFYMEMTQKLQNAYCCAEEKFVLTQKIIDSIKGKVLIFCKYIASANECAKRFPTATVLTYGKHSFGLNLQDYNITIYFDKTFDYAQRLQAGYRTYRVGQKENCYYYDLTGNVGLESLINRNIETKTNLLEYFKSKSVEELRNEL